MAGRFPAARTVEELWLRLRAGTDCLRRFSDEELLAAGVSADLLRTPGYVRAQGFLDDIDRFAAGLNDHRTGKVRRKPELVASVGEWLLRHTGNDSNFLSTRTSYELDLKGPSISVQTACSSSLVAVHLACQSLLAGECDLALAGGSVISPVQDRGYLYKEGEILSPDGHCRAFDAT